MKRGRIPAELSDAYTYYLCAELFGWTPKEVDEIDAVLLTQILIIARAVKEHGGSEKWQRDSQLQ